MTSKAVAPAPDAQRLAQAAAAFLVWAFAIVPALAYVLHGSPLWIAALHICLVLPLAWRRCSPELVFGIIAGVAFVQWLAYHPMPGDAALLMALFTVASTRRQRTALAAAAVLELGVILAVTEHPGILAKVFAFIFLSGLTTAATVLGINVQTRRAYLREVEERAARLEVERDQQAQLAAADERARVAREMHDIVAHNLAVMIALTDGAALTVTSNPERTRAALTEAAKAGRAALADMRRVLGVLRDPEDDAVLAPAPLVGELDDLMAKVRHTGLDIRYRTSGPVAALPQALQLSAFRIVQEALTNVMKHAHGVRVVTVDLRATGDELAVVVQDDGRPRSDTPGDGHGLAGMRERAMVHGGTLSAGRSTTGWQVEARLSTNHVREESS